MHFFLLFYLKFSFFKKYFFYEMNLAITMLRFHLGGGKNGVNKRGALERMMTPAG